MAGKKKKVSISFMAKVKDNKNVDYWQDAADYIIMLKEAIRNDGM